MDEVKTKLKQKRERELEKQVLQGQLPFMPSDYYEQSNYIARSNLFRCNKPRGGLVFNTWTDVFTINDTPIKYMGPVLTVPHEEIWCRLLSWARGRSLTKPVPIIRSELLKDMGKSAGGGGYARIEEILSDLGQGKVIISSRPAVEKIYKVLTSPEMSQLPDGDFFTKMIKNRYSDSLKMIAEALKTGASVEIEMNFIEKRIRSSNGRESILLDPITCLFFDGVNTTLLPYDVRANLDNYGKKLLTFINSHRDGVYNTSLKKLYEMGFNAEFEKNERTFKSKLIKRLTEYEGLGYVCAGWGVKKNRDGVHMVSGMKAGEAIKLTAPDPLTLHPELLDDYFDDEIVEQEVLRI